MNAVKTWLQKPQQLNNNVCLQQQWLSFLYLHNICKQLTSSDLSHLLYQ